MDFSNLINGISSKEDLVDFLYNLSDDKRVNETQWENKDVESYIEGIAAWIEDMEGYYKNTGKEMPQNVDWSFIATLLYVGKIYE